jgi:protein TonB
LPEYPMRAKRLGREGSLLLRLTIDKQGRVVEVEVVKKAGSGFDEAAVKAIRASTFAPAMKNGRPVACRTFLPIRFQLRNRWSLP